MSTNQKSALRYRPIEDEENNQGGVAVMERPSRRGASGPGERGEQGQRLGMRRGERNPLCVNASGRPASQPAPTTSRPGQYDDYEDEEERQTRPPRQASRPERQPMTRRAGNRPPTEENRRPAAAKRRGWVFWAMVAVLAIMGAYVLIFLIGTLGRSAYYRLAYGPQPTAQISAVTGYSNEPATIQASTLAGHVSVLITVPGKQPVLVTGPAVDGSPVLDLKQESDGSIQVSVQQPSGLFNWAPSPYTFNIVYTKNTFTVQLSPA